MTDPFPADSTAARPPAHPTMTHADLVARAASWLRNTRRCGVVLTECSGGGHEIPDAIGWRSGGRVSTLVECKASRADFLRDGKKWHRRHGDVVGIGQERFYFAPPGLIRVEELPAGWGLAEVCGGVVRVRKNVKCTVIDPEIIRREIGFLYSAAWKAQNLPRESAPSRRHARPSQCGNRRP